MRLSTKGRYAVMAMVDLAQHSGGDPISLAEIAERQEISLSYLEQLFAMLRVRMQHERHRRSRRASVVISRLDSAFRPVDDYVRHDCSS